MKMHPLVKYTAINFVKLVAFIIALLIAVLLIVGAIVLVSEYMGHPLWGIIPLSLVAILAVSVFMATMDVDIENTRNSRILDRLKDD